MPTLQPFRSNFLGWLETPSASGVCSDGHGRGSTLQPSKLFTDPPFAPDPNLLWAGWVGQKLKSCGLVTCSQNGTHPPPYQTFHSHMSVETCRPLSFKQAAQHGLPSVVIVCSHQAHALQQAMRDPPSNPRHFRSNHPSSTIVLPHHLELGPDSISSSIGSVSSQ